MRRALLSATRLAPKSSVALRPRLATGVPFRGGRPDERGQPRVHVRRIRRIRFAIRSAYWHWVPGPRRRDYEQPVLTALHARDPTAHALPSLGLGFHPRCRAAPRM